MRAPHCEPLSCESSCTGSAPVRSAFRNLSTFLQRSEDMETTKQSRASRARQAQRTQAAVLYVVEGLENRVMLSGVVPNTTPLNTGSGAVKTIVQDLTKLQNLADEIIKVDNKLTS